MANPNQQVELELATPPDNEFDSKIEPANDEEFDDVASIEDDDDFTLDFDENDEPVPTKKEQIDASNEYESI